MVTIFVILITIYLISYLLLTCNKLSKENMKLQMENMAIHELYLNRTKCQCKKTLHGSYPEGIDDIPVEGEK